MSLCWLVFLLLGYEVLAFQASYRLPALSRIGGKPPFGSTSRYETQLALGNFETSSLNISLDDSPFGLLLGLGFVASIAAFVFANVVFTPEILEGAKDLRREERQEEISKILEAVRTHDGDVSELRVPLETALGKSLEEYVGAVLDESKDDDEYSLYTVTDTELAKLLKQDIIS